MLNTCAPNVSVVNFVANIDNGLGAACIASLLLIQSQIPHKKGLNCPCQFPHLHRNLFTLLSGSDIFQKSPLHGIQDRRNTMFCPSCGTPSVPDQHFCKKCGATIATAGSAQTVPPAAAAPAPQAVPPPAQAPVQYAPPQAPAAYPPPAQYAAPQMPPAYPPPPAWVSALSEHGAAGP